MYLAKLRTGYQLRQSFRVGEYSFDYRIVYELGPDPTKFFEIIEDRIVLFDYDLVQAVAIHTEEDEESVLERLLWNFLPKEIQQRLSLFQARKARQPGPLTADNLESIARQVHIFDRRRLYYLRYGAVDQSRLSRLHEKCCRPLLGQSRDEREYYFNEEERVIEPGHYLQYVYAIFNLQRYFHQSFAPWLPESLAFEEMADHFERELCRLNRDPRFWQKEAASNFLHHHLARYLIMFFDYRPAQRSFFEDFLRSFMAGHRSFRWPEKKSSRSPEKIMEVFSISKEELQKLTKQQLNRLYRKKAMQLHPDRGGDHDLFIELTEIYNELLRTK